MGRRRDKPHHLPKFHTLPSSPTHSFSSSSSDFEFTVSLSPRKSSAALCPADELFYKGQILPLHLSPRLSMVRTLLLASSSSSSDTTTTASRDSTGSSTDSHSSFSSDLSQLHPESSRPSSVSEDAIENFRCIGNNVSSLDKSPIKKPSKFSLSKLSSVFRKEPKNISSSPTSSQKGTSKSAKEVISKYLKKVKPLYEKISQKQQVKVPSSSSTTTATRMARSANPTLCMKKDGSIKERVTISALQNKWKENHNATISHSFSGNTRHTRRKSCISSCPSSIRSSPNHSGILRRNGFTPTSTTTTSTYADNSSIEELQSAIQGAIAHCKSSML
ncbi:Hypothetical predicted protein [Olea europaea subsp. europaea]|uniref:Membrane-associated kinase regulator 1 n=1 Tax=Olea europaea subsp. europaea TaxID=158383 RepID=A0A8S0PTT1_OLEEU|nr:Hypothetical predicted protein [Olea europaea subsp. europaea]